MHSSNSDPTLSAQSQSVMTPGAMLRAAREAKGIHLAVLSVTLKVPTRQLEALENDQYDAFRGPAFVRAVAQSMSRHLGIDPASVLAGLPKTATSVSLRPSADTLPIHQTVRLRRMGGGRVSRQVLLLGALMLLGSAALIWWPTSPSVTEVPPSDVVEPMQMTLTEASDPVAFASAPETSVQPPASLPSSPASVPISIAPLKTEASPTAANAASEPSLPAIANAPELLIAASGDTWLEVRDARGQLVVNRMLRGGETQRVDVPPPFNVVVGRAQLVRVTRGGKDVDLAPYTKASTARFDIQP